MRRDPTCPTTDEFEQLLNGTQPPSSADALAGHLESCGRCADTVRVLLATDTFAGGLRAVPSATDPSSGEIPADLISRLVALRPPTGDTTVTVVRSPADTSDLTEVVPPYLAAAEAADELGRLAGYRIARRIGQGGMGVVYDAVDTALNRRVALKVLAPVLAGNREQRERFLREARAAAAVEHDHVCPIYQVGESNGVPFLAMPLLAGEALAERLKRQPVLPLTDAVRIAREIADGLAAAHAAGVIHRDIKPGNVWLEARPGKPDRVRLLDFGLACPVQGGGDITAPGTVLGTPAYMAPEQARGKRVDARADLFSLGVVLYEMLTGRRPFPGTEPISILASVALDEPLAPEALSAAIPHDLSALVMRLLAKRREARPTSARQVAEELAVFEKAATEPVTPRPAPRRRSPWPVALAVALFALVIGLAGYKLVFETRNGTLVVELADGVDARFKDGELHIFDESGKKKYALSANDRNQAMPPGKYTVKVAGADGVTLDTEEFKIEKDGKAVVRVIARAPEVAKKDDPKPPAAGDPHRDLAMWVFSKGGTVQLLPDYTQAIASPDALPAGAITLAGLSVRDVRDSADAKVLLKLLDALGPKGNVGLQLNGTAFDDEFLKGLAATGVGRWGGFLNLGQSSVTANGLRHLRRERDAGHFHMDLNTRPDGDALVRALLKNVTPDALVLRSTDLTDDGVKAMAGARISGLNLDNNPKVTDASVPLLAAMPALKDVELGGTGVTEAGLKRLAELTKGREFTINVNHQKYDPTAKPEVAPPKRDDAADRALAEWVIGKGGVIAFAPDVEKNYRKGDPFPAGPLTVARVHLTTDAEADTKELLTRLKAAATPPGFIFWVNGKGFTDTWAKEAFALPVFRRAATLIIGGTAITAAGWKQLKRDEPTEFFALGLSNQPLGDAGVDALAAVNSFNELGLSNCGVTDAGVKQLAEVRIAGLRLGNNPKVTDASIPVLAAIPGLKTVELGGTGVTEAGLKKLAELTKGREFTILVKDKTYEAK